MSVRDRFPIMDRLTYINACSHGALSDAVAAAYGQYLEDRHREGSPWGHWMGMAETTRASFARLIGSEPNEVAITTSASAGVSSIASAFDFSGARNRIVTTDFSFPALGQIWKAQERRGAEVVRIPAGDDGIAIEAFEEAIDDRTAIVSATHVCYWNGHRLDIPAIARVAHDRGALVLADSYQALGSFPISVEELGVDFLVGGTIKYLLGPAGLAFVYARQSTTEHLQPTALGWFSQRDVFAMDHTQNDPSPDARRFEFGTPPIPNLYAGLAGLELVHEIGVDRIWDQIKSVTAAIVTRAEAGGLALATPSDPNRRGAMIAVRSSDAEALVERCGESGVIVSSRAGNVRVSPHVYNDERDVDALFAVFDVSEDLLDPALV